MLDPRDVFCARAPAASYGFERLEETPELARDRPAASCALVTLRALLARARLDPSRLGTAAWNPLGDLIAPSSRVVIKPNWVLHRNGSGQGLESLVTHTTVLEALLGYVLLARPRDVVVGDAPIQGCDFDALRASCSLDERLGALGARDAPVRIADFRRTIRSHGGLSALPQEDQRSLDEYVLVDLGASSALDPITTDAVQFRVTMYDPDLLAAHHRRGRHEYLIARDLLEADVVINVPKLKTHKKAGITAALKNLVGINGNKEFLPHHRKGGSGRGGDCYPGRGRVKEVVEELLDATNRTRSLALRRIYAGGTRIGSAVGRLLGDRGDYEGSWHGNDTVWRMCHDLGRILHYARRDGTLAPDPQRVVLHLTDGIVAGEGEGPLAPTPAPLGVLTLGSCAASLDWVHSLLIGLDPRRIPLVREAFAAHPLPLAPFAPEEIRAHVDGERVALDEILPRAGRRLRPPSGWKGHCELGGPGADLAHPCAPAPVWSWASPSE